MLHQPALIAESGITYGTGSGRDLQLDILRPDLPLEPPRPAVVWAHGGGWLGGARSPSPNPVLARIGFVTASISYRFSDEAMFPAQIHDVKAAIRFLRVHASRWGIDPDRIGIWGGSAGGHLAALAAVTGGLAELEGEGGNPGVSSGVRAAAALCPPTDFLVPWWEEVKPPADSDLPGIVSSLLGGLPGDSEEIDERARLASPARLVPDDPPPVLVVHGTRDSLVPVSQGRRFVEVLQERGADATLLELPDDEHGLASVFGAVFGDDASPGPAMQRIVDFFTRTLGPVDAT